MKKPQETTQAKAAKATPARRRSASAKKASATNPLDEIRALRQEVAELQRRLVATQSAPSSPSVANNFEPWLKIAATVGVTFALGKIMQALRLPAAAAVAVPMISAEVNRRFF